jgi:hypothetical protein
MTLAPVKCRASSLVTVDGLMLVLTMVDNEGRFVGRLELDASQVGGMIVGLVEADGKLTTRCGHDER